MPFSATSKFEVVKIHIKMEIVFLKFQILLV